MEGGWNNVSNVKESISNNQQRREWERRKDIAKKVLDGYETRTGLSLSSRSQLFDHNGTTLRESPRRRRYLWTDAFALANYVSLMMQDEKDQSREGALNKNHEHLIDAVHETLGKHRLDHKDPQKKGRWLPNSSSEHPTAGGLRIGKSQDERPTNVSYHGDTEWEKDGQYFHYLTKWGTALDMVTRSNSNQKYTLWAMELLHVAASKFVTHQYGRPQMYWKLSIDLSRPLVTSQGARDALEGYILASRLIGTCEDCQIFSPLLPNMFDCQRIFHSMIRIAETDDPLELGGMLLDMCQLFMLEKRMGTDDHRKAILQDMKMAVMIGLESFDATNELETLRDERTPFRELGLSLGLRAMERLFLEESKLSSSVLARSRHYLSGFEEILVFLPLAEQLEAFWLDAENQSTKSWMDHLDMNEVMLVSSLNPCCWLQ